MGTDIHLFVESREHNKWICCDVGESASFYSERDYDVFAILAGVRNGYGVAGVETGDGFVPIAARRGMPDDLSPELSEAKAYFFDNFHSHSWLLLSEVMAFDWRQVTTHRGFVNAEAFADWSEWRRGAGHRPESYYLCLPAKASEQVSENEMAKRIEAIKASLDDDPLGLELKKSLRDTLSDTYCQVSWVTPYYRAAKSFLGECVPRLWRLGKPEDVRVVFWFDS